MKTVTITESEYLQMQQTIQKLEARINLLQDQSFLKKLVLAYEVFIANEDKNSESDILTKLPLKKGAAKHIITYIADDFDAPLNDFKEYM